MALLEVKDLNVYYGVIHAVKSLNMHVDEGEVVSLIGANGAGKTTTLQTISGLVRAKSGIVTFDGRDITKEPAHKILKYGIAQVPEGRRVFRTLSVKDNLELGAYANDESEEAKEQRVAHILERFPILQERQEQAAGTLSGGEQQMLAIGRALMSNPKLLVLDEPSMGLSPLFVNEVFSILRHLAESGVTILLVEQNAKKALSIASRAYVIETGNITAEGEAEEMQGNPEVRKAYLGA